MDGAEAGMRIGKLEERGGSPVPATAGLLQAVRARVRRGGGLVRCVPALVP
jgi:hypothetical protein